MAITSAPATTSVIAPLKALALGQVIMRENVLAIPPSKATYTLCACKLPNHRRSFPVTFEKVLVRGPSANSLMHAKYTWTAGGSITRCDKARTPPKRAIDTVQYLRPCNAMIEFRNKITAQYFTVFSLKV